MAPHIMLPRDFDVSNVSFSDVKMLENGGKIVYVSYNKAPLIVQTPAMAAPFGMSRWEGDHNSNVKYSLDLSFKDIDSFPSMKAFHTMLDALDTRLVQHGFDNQHSWFKGKRYGSKEIVEALYTPMLKYAKDKATGERTDDYPPTFKVTVPHKDGSFACDVFNAQRAPVDLGTVETKGSRITAIVQCTGVWFAGGKFGVSWKVKQMKVAPNSTKLVGYALIDDGDDVDDQQHQEDSECNLDVDADADAAAAAPFM
jgi:hypothetical protein